MCKTFFSHYNDSKVETELQKLNGSVASIADRISSDTATSSSEKVLNYAEILKHPAALVMITVASRGGVERTRLDAKAKDTKKYPRPRPRTQKNIPGQGQPFRGQNLSRPRTGMLQAKAKDQRHSLKCSPTKKGLQSIFQAISTL